MKRTKVLIFTVIILAIVLLILSFVLFGKIFLSKTTEKDVAEKDKPITVTEKTDEYDKPLEATSIDDIIQNMSVSEIVYQMMFVTPEALTGVDCVTSAGETTKNALKERPVGGIVYFAQSLVDRQQTIEMISNSQKYSKIGLFISVDEEGGRVSRLGQNPDMGTTKHPPMREIGNTGDTKKAYEVGVTLGRELKELGFNVDFAPDADIVLNDENTEIGDRSFGNAPALVASMVENVVKGMQDNGVSSTIKHFPGHGSTIVDSHTGYSASERTLEELRTCEFLPFKSGINAGADFVMVSHMTLVNATKEKVPSSISKEVITDMLINELGFNGIVITDSFSMGAIVEEYSVAEAAVMSINAGADMVLMPANLEEIHSAIVSAVENGEISRERIEKSVRKILKLKEEKGLLS